ncbi:hypothetical protein AB9K35_17050 [Leisingera sp. XS_AS12]|uniref:hypothetical protein n=1 Tax=Leisingera sp. XS_AS12 TaxID=3241294 RepID=UPI003510F676
MQVKLYFKDIDGDAVPYLWNDEMGLNHQEDGSQRIASRNDMEIARMNCSNRSRSITITEGRQAAQTIALMAQGDGARSIMTAIGDDNWAVGTLHMDGSYDDGIPKITDLRSYGEEITIEADDDLADACQYVMLAEEHEPNVVEISPQVAAEPAFC